MGAVDVEAVRARGRDRDGRAWAERRVGARVSVDTWEVVCARAVGEDEGSRW